MAEHRLACNDTALVDAVKKKKASVVADLLKNGADIHTRNDYAIRWAASYSKEVAEILMGHGDYGQTDPNLALIGYACLGDFQKMEEMLAKGADIHEERERVLRDAARRGDEKVIEFALAHGADLRTKSYPEWDTPLRVTIEKGHEKATETLAGHYSLETLRNLAACCAWIPKDLIEKETARRLKKTAKKIRGACEPLTL